MGPAKGMLSSKKIFMAVLQFKLISYKKKLKQIKNQYLSAFQPQDDGVKIMYKGWI